MARGGINEIRRIRSVNRNIIVVPLVSKLIRFGTDVLPDRLDHGLHGGLEVDRYGNAEFQHSEHGPVAPSKGKPALYHW